MKNKKKASLFDAKLAAKDCSLESSVWGGSKDQLILTKNHAYKLLPFYSLSIAMNNLLSFDSVAV